MMRKDEQLFTVPEGLGAITIRDVRCACGVCGAHVVAWQGQGPGLSGMCENCGSYDMRALPGLSPDRGFGDHVLLQKQPVFALFDRP